MKKVIENSDAVVVENGRSKIKNFFGRQAQKLKEGQFTCPFCREVSHGLSEFGAHLKSHCT